jgi:hypothetical protein
MARTGALARDDRFATHSKIHHVCAHDERRPNAHRRELEDRSTLCAEFREQQQADSGRKQAQWLCIAVKSSIRVTQARDAKSNGRHGEAPLESGANETTGSEGQYRQYDRRDRTVNGAGCGSNRRNAVQLRSVSVLHGES